MFDPAGQSSDASLLTRAAGGETACFEALVRRYESALRRVAHSRLGRADWAEDVVQETFLSAFKGRASYDPRFNFRTWLWTILLNQCRAHYQRRMRSVPLAHAQREGGPAALEVESLSDSPLGNLLAKERTAQLEALLGQLSEPQADALRLRFFASLKFQEIADAMQCSLNTAKNRVRLGLLRMGELLEAADVRAAGRGRGGWE